MTKNHVPISGKRIEETAWKITWATFLYGCTVLLLTVLAWLLVRPAPFSPGFRSSTLVNGVSLVFIQAGLTLALERALVFTPLRSTWRYRLAFLTSSGLGGIFWIIRLAISYHPVQIWQPVLVGAGALAGGILATGLNIGWWENNSPPSERVRAEVQARHQQVIGQLPGTPWQKRVFDLVLAGIGLVFSLPVWMLCVLGVWLEDPGPILFVKNSVGKGGKNFQQYKFRTMVSGAEVYTGPVLAKEKDERILFAGRLLRKTALDELPQLINILAGEMSIVGPRPQRTVLVRQYLEALPAYADRHRVLPGIAGLAQVAGDYYLTPHQKLRFDRLYIRYSSLGFDLKLILLALLITFWYRWKPGWNGRLARNLLRLGGKKK